MLPRKMPLPQKLIQTESNLFISILSFRIMFLAELVRLSFCPFRSTSTRGRGPHVIFYSCSCSCGVTHKFDSWLFHSSVVIVITVANRSVFVSSMSNLALSRCQLFIINSTGSASHATNRFLCQLCINLPRAWFCARQDLLFCNGLGQMSMLSDCQVA